MANDVTLNAHAPSPGMYNVRIPTLWGQWRFLWYMLQRIWRRRLRWSVSVYYFKLHKDN